jgi:hypothetical protein
LNSWLDERRSIPLAQTHDWKNLEQAAGAEQIFSQLASRLCERTFHPALTHGDLAPWNIKVSSRGDWTVLDWERANRNGIPGWDWFHYVLQTAILVERQPVSGLIQELETLLTSEPLRAYAQRAGIAGFEKELALAYLLHSIHVIRPSEGLAKSQELLNALGGVWLR